MFEYDDKFTKTEARYWNERGIREFPSGLGEWYKENYLGLDQWGMYDYAKQLRTLPKNAPILEVGAGTVAKATFLALFEGYTNITVSDLSIEQMRINWEFSREAGLGDKVKHVVADMTSLPFRNETFSSVFVNSALHHLPDTKGALSEMIRCLQPGGLLIIGHEPNRKVNQIVRRFADRLHLSEKYQEDQHSEADDELPGLNQDELVQLLPNLQVQVLKVLPHWYMMGFVHPLPLVLERTLGKRIDVPTPVRTLTRSVDSVLSKLPGMSNLSFYFSLIGKKR